MANRNLRELEVFLAEQSVALEDHAFGLEPNSHGWRMVRERSSTAP